MLTLGHLAKKTCTQYVDSVAVKDRFGKLTYGELKEKACKLAHALFGMGMKKGDRLAVLMSNRKEHVEIDIAVAMTGMIKVPVNYKLHPKEIEYVLDDSGSSIVIGEKQLLNSITHNGKSIEIEEEYDEILDMQPHHFPMINVTEDDLFTLMYTSGTTGKPKGAMLSHRAMVSSAQSLMMACEITYGDTIGHVAPLTHGTNFLSQCALFFGSKQVIFDKFEPHHFIDDLEKEKINVMFMVPTIVNLMIHEPNFDPDKLRHLKSINMAGAPMAVDKLEKALNLMGPILAETYGLVEAPMTITMMPKQKLPDRPASCGATGPMVEMKVRNENKEEVQPGEVGEVTCKGPLVMDGYWNNAKATEESLQDGWFYTGDMGWVDAYDHLHLVDRKKDVIISGGMNIYPREVEEVLNQHESVKETCVFGVPDEKWGENVYAHIVLNENVAEAREDDLLNHCKEHMASYKKPKLIKVVQDLPKSSYGKILRRSLRDQYREEVK